MKERLGCRGERSESGRRVRRKLLECTIENSDEKRQLGQRELTKWNTDEADSLESPISFKDIELLVKNILIIKISGQEFPPRCRRLRIPLQQLGQRQRRRCHPWAGAGGQRSCCRSQLCMGHS